MAQVDNNKHMWSTTNSGVGDEKSLMVDVPFKQKRLVSTGQPSRGNNYKDSDNQTSKKAAPKGLLACFQRM